MKLQTDCICELLYIPYESLCNGFWYSPFTMLHRIVAQLPAIRNALTVVVLISVDLDIQW